MMAKKHLSPDKQSVIKSSDGDTDIYYFENMHGLLIHHKFTGNPKVHCFHSYLIPWRMLRASLKRKDKK